MAKHASLGASSAKRWFRCSASPRFIKEAGVPNVSGQAAKDGTAVHAVIEKVLEGKFQEARDAVGKTIKGVLITDHLADSAQMTVDYAREQMELYPNAEMLLETHVDLAPYAPPGEPLYGTSDINIIARSMGILHVIDHKNGRHIVEVANNEQTLYYGLGAWLALPPDIQADIHTVKMTIVQPNAMHHEGPIRSDSISVLDLLGWGETLRQKALDTTGPNARFVPGEHCEFCPPKNQCSARMSQKELDAITDFVPDLEPGPLSPTVVEQVKLLTPQEVADFVAQAEKISKLIEDGKKFLTKEIMEGRPVAGYKLVEGPGRRAFYSTIPDSVLAYVLRVDEEEVDDTLEAMGLSKHSVTIPDVLKMLQVDEAIYWEPRKPVSPSQLEKRLGRRHPHYKSLALLSERKPGRPLLVPESDSRPAYDSPEIFDVAEDVMEGEFTVDD